MFPNGSFSIQYGNRPLWDKLVVFLLLTVQWNNQEFVYAILDWLGDVRCDFSEEFFQKLTEKNGLLKFVLKALEHVSNLIKTA